MPGIDSVNTKLTTCLHESRRPFGNVGNVVRGRAPFRMFPEHPVAGALFEWDQEIRGWQILFDLQIPIKRKPEIFRPAEVHEREGHGCAPAPQKAPPRNPAPDEIADSADGRPVNEAPHRVIELVIADPEEIDVVRETNCKPVP